jgi:hypothetical protein
MDTDTTDCTIYDCLNANANADANANATTTNYLFNPVFAFFLIFSTVTLFYHCTTKSDLSLFEEFLRVSREHNFHKLLVSSGKAVGEMIANLTDNATTTDHAVATTDAEDTVMNEPKFEDKFLDKYLALKLQSTMAPTPEFIESLMNCFVMEYTPNGNIIMFYDYKRETFAYYADNVMPYRYLEVLGRKYVCAFFCPSLYQYLPPDQVLNVATNDTGDTGDTGDTVENEKKEETVKTVVLEIDPTKLEKPEKSVFAKFKSYNKDTSNNVATKDAPSSAHKRATNAPTVVLTNVIRNRYTCHGKICNMPFLKKIDRVVVDKNYKMSFADFKRLNSNS